MEKVQTQIVPFDYSGTQVRTVIIDGEPHFVAKDICAVLEITNHKDAVGRLDPDEVRGSVLPTPGGVLQEYRVLTESGLYHLLFISRRPEAKKFRRWVTQEVLPSIRKNGGYGTPVSLDARAGAWLDLRDLPYDKVELDGSMVRRVVHEEREYFSLNDVTTAIGTRTKSGQVADKLNVKQPLALRIMLFGMTHPGWFATRQGVQLLLSGSRKMKDQGKILVFASATDMATAATRPVQLAFSFEMSEKEVATK